MVIRGESKIKWKLLEVVLAGSLLGCNLFERLLSQKGPSTKPSGDYQFSFGMLLRTFADLATGGNVGCGDYTMCAGTTTIMNGPSAKLIDG